MNYSKEHGEYVVGRSCQTILFSGRGPWNDETLLRGTKDMGRNIQQLDFTKPWGCLSCLVGESLMPPSTFQNFVKQTAIRKSKGLKGLAVVIKDSDIKNTIEQQLTNAYQSAGVDYAFLTSIEFALNWLGDREIRLEADEVAQFFQKLAFSRVDDH